MSKNFVYTEKVTGAIVQIPIELLHHHHDNPRKDLGDLTELTDSIKAKGVLQNLTVVPYWFKTTGVGCDDPEEQAKMGYLVVIGNRRLEAAKAAGLKTLPCIIAKMSPAEQVQTMLLENMQRSDLTVYEQAQGFQMMLDLGDTVEGISEKTGFSKTTVRRRLKMTELNQDTLKQVSDRQTSLEDFDRLNEIKNIEARNKVLAQIGTNNFENELAKALKAQETAKRKENWERLFKERGMKELPYSDIWSSKYGYPAPGVGYLDGDADRDKLDKMLTEDVQYYYAWSVNSGTPYIRKDVKETDKASVERAESERRRAEADERRRKLYDVAERAYKLRFAFVRDYSYRNSKANIEKIGQWIQLRQITELIHHAWFSGYSTAMSGTKTFYALYGFESENLCDPEVHTKILEFVAKHPEKALLFHAYSLWCDSKDGCCVDYAGRFKENKKLKALYQGLCALGYQMSDEEIEMLNGTSKLYIREQMDNSVEDENSFDVHKEKEVSDDDFDKDLAEQLKDLAEQFGEE